MTSETTQLRDQAETVGIMLQAARQQRGLSVKHVADAQHLRPSIITAIEEGRYDVIGSELFLKGYIRAYASQVGLDGDAIIRSLDGELIPLRKEKEEAQETNPLVAIERRKRKKRRTARLVLVLLVVGVAAVFAWQLLVPHNEPSVPVAEDPAPQTSAIDADPDLSKSDLLGTENTALAPVATDDREEAPVKAEPVEAEPVEAEQTVAEPAPTPEPESPVAKASDQSVNTVSVQASFSDDCWIQITDGQGQRLVATLKRSGETVDVSGSPPLKVVIGAMSGLSELTFQNEVVDLAAYSVTNNRAVFSLGDSIGT